MPLTPDLVEQLTPETPAPDQAKFGDTARARRLAWTRYFASKEFAAEHVLPYLPERFVWHVGVGLIPTLGITVEAPGAMMKAISNGGFRRTPSTQTPPRF
jgi:hypothetical protein